ncbi:MAG: thioredoxin family protein [Parcubacteria group bacterium]|jgi:small redox-active disulfide protein 2
MNIKILGTGCPNCLKLEANVKKALEELKVEAQVEKITDILEIMKYGVMGTPALVINEKVETTGRIPDISEIKTVLSK